MGRMRNAYIVLVGRPEIDHLEDLAIDGKIVLI
jgi:hypothetical protein